MFRVFIISLFIAVSFSFSLSPHSNKVCHAKYSIYMCLKCCSKDKHVPK